ncbi:hypothetical protein KCQ_14590 [Pectobacterium atrosepticum ICMP 1526]|nr:hypothetical protein KCQ_14590 [Pectobacterium atrosepticum ICMP 1526]
MLFKNVSDVFVRRGTGFRGVHAAHSAVTLTSAQFLRRANLPETIESIQHKTMKKQQC